MSTADIGVVRVLAPGTPGVPGPGAWWRGEAGYDSACRARIPVDAVPLLSPAWNAVSYLCTRDAADCNGLHVCHFRPIGGGYEPTNLIVWGGE